LKQGAGTNGNQNILSTDCHALVWILRTVKLSFASAPLPTDHRRIIEKAKTWDNFVLKQPERLPERSVYRIIIMTCGTNHSLTLILATLYIVSFVLSNALVHALYTQSGPVTLLNPRTFNEKIRNSKHPAVVEFFAPW